jgi:hypothetical protein
MDIPKDLLRACLAAIDGQQTGLIDEGEAFDVAVAIDRVFALEDREWRAEYHARHAAMDDARESLEEAIEAGDERAIDRARDGVTAVEQNLRRWLEDVIEEGTTDVG